MASCMSPSQGTLATAARTTDGSLAYQSTILPTSGLGNDTPSAAVSGDTAGVASDGTNMFVVTGNTFNTTQGNWSGW